MQTLLRFRIICFALILFGSFANFAQNLWGNDLITLMEALLAISFFTESVIIILKRIKARQLKAFNMMLLVLISLFFLYPLFTIIIRDDMFVNLFILSVLLVSALIITDGIISFSMAKNNKEYFTGLYENCFLFFVLNGFFFRNMHWPGHNEFLILGITFLVPFYISKTISFIRHEFKKGKLLVTLLSIGSFATVVLGFGLLFKRMHWPGGSQMIITGFILTGLLIIGSLKWKYNFNQESINILKALRLLKTQIVSVYFALFILCFHGYLGNLGLAPKFYSTIRPAAVDKLNNGTTKGEMESWKLMGIYQRFVENSKKNGFIK